MKNYKKISFIGVFAILFAFISCTTEPEIGSSITEYAVFEYEPIIVLPIGSTFSPSAVAKEGGISIPVTTSGTVDTNTIGIYNVNYSAVNADGFTATASQTIVVHDPTIVGANVSGNIQDKNNNSRKGVISLIEGTNSIFYATDFGFSGVFPMYFQMNGNVASSIPQPYAFSVTGVTVVYNPTNQQFSVGPILPYGFSYTFEYY